MLSILPLSSFFSGVLRSLSQLSIDEVKTGQSCFESPAPRVRGSIFPSNAKKHSPFVPFFGQLGKIFFSRSNLNDFCFTTGAFNFSPYLVTLLSTTAQLEIKISDRSSMTTATYMTGAQSKASIKLC